MRIHSVVEMKNKRGYATKELDRKSTRLNSSHSQISYAVFCLKKKNKKHDGNFRIQHEIFPPPVHARTQIVRAPLRSLRPDPRFMLLLGQSQCVAGSVSSSQRM